MDILFVLIIISLLVASGFLIAFLWAVKSGQYDDDYTPSVRMLFDDEPEPTKPTDSETEIKTETTNNKTNQS